MSSEFIPGTCEFKYHEGQYYMKENPMDPFSIPPVWYPISSNSVFNVLNHQYFIILLSEDYGDIQNNIN